MQLDQCNCVVDQSDLKHLGLFPLEKYNTISTCVSSEKLKAIAVIDYNTNVDINISQTLHFLRVLLIKKSLPQ